ncbi:GNAT family N-acetyltransferase [Hahella sp. NBU794]|uniref:GNAT family N-acetyltransferase n=1 Tax=Hahella sp. NBU794 TaxID=3422590 RepID=UPI003D6E3419
MQSIEIKAPLTLTTERLRLRQFTEADLPDYAKMLADDEVMRYMANGQGYDLDAAWKSLALMLGHWRLRGYGLWALEEIESGRLLGRAGLYYPQGWPGMEIGWLLRRASWGQGYAYEAAQAIRDVAFSHVGASSLVSLIHPMNARSRRLAEKLGGKASKTLEIQQKQVLLYSIPKS